MSSLRAGLYCDTSIRGRARAVEVAWNLSRDWQGRDHRRLGEIDLFTTDPEGLRGWYVKHFGATVTTQGNATITNVPGMDFSFRKTDAPQSATKGRSLDHIGFEVRGLEAFCKKLEAEGVAFDAPFRDVPSIGLKIAFVLDPAGTRIELTEGLAGR
jgi:catechol 2,3-dioxygenase-like lactoylglutathione lyase family enzyme